MAPRASVVTSLTVRRGMCGSSGGMASRGPRRRCTLGLGGNLDRLLPLLLIDFRRLRLLHPRRVSQFGLPADPALERAQRSGDGLQRRAFPGTRAADDLAPDHRRLAPAEPRRHPACVADQRPRGRQQRESDIVRRRRSPLGGIGDPITPDRPEDVGARESRWRIGPQFQQTGVRLRQRRFVGRSGR